MTHARLALPALVLAVSTACFPAKVPLQQQFHPGADPDTLVVLLPGFMAHDHTLQEKGVVGALRDAGVQADVVAVDATYGYYVRDMLTDRLEADVFSKMRGRYEHIWVMGISMGGLGTLLTADTFTEDIDGIVLLSPFLGRKKTTTDVREAGGLDGWAQTDPEAWDEDVWTFLDGAKARGWEEPAVYLGYGTKDLGMKNLEMLAAELPPERVMMADGGHTWPVWAELTERFARDVLLTRSDFRAPPEDVGVLRAAGAGIEAVGEALSD